MCLQASWRTPWSFVLAETWKYLHLLHNNASHLADFSVSSTDRRALFAGELEDTMESFVLAETWKYLYLLHSNASHLADFFVFSTEGHLLAPLPATGSTASGMNLSLAAIQLPY